MPTYTYRCSEEKCKHEFDIVQKMSDDKLTDCPECKEEGSLEKIITATAGFQLKGNGWFNKGGY